MSEIDVVRHEEGDLEEMIGVHRIERSNFDELDSSEFYEIVFHPGGTVLDGGCHRDSRGSGAWSCTDRRIDAAKPSRIGSKVC